MITRFYSDDDIEEVKTRETRFEVIHEIILKSGDKILQSHYKELRYCEHCRKEVKK